MEWRGVELRDCARLCEIARGHAARPEITRDRAARDHAARPGAEWMGWERGGGSAQCGRSVSSRRVSRTWEPDHPLLLSALLSQDSTYSGCRRPKLSLPFLPAGVGRARGRRVCGMRAQLENRAFLVRDQSAKDHFWVRDRERQVRDRSPPLTPADGHHLCFWLRHRPKRAQCARRHRASSPLRGAACCADAFLWLSSRAFCVPAGGRACVV